VGAWARGCDRAPLEWVRPNEGQAWWCAHLIVRFLLIVSNSGIVCMRRWMGASFPADDWKIRILVAHQQQLRAQVSAGVGDPHGEAAWVCGCLTFCS